MTNKKIPGLVALGDDRYRLRCWGPGPDGARFQWSTVFTAKGKRDRDKLIATFRHEATTGILAARERAKSDAESAPSRTTSLATYAERWLRHRTSSKKVGAAMLHRYRSLVRDMITPVLGDVALADVTPARVNDAVALWRTMPRRDRKKGQLSDRTVHHAFSVLKAILQSAFDEELVTRNPAAKVDVAKGTSREIQSLDAAGVAKLLAGLRGTMLEMPAMLAIWTGLRRGELLGLRWSDVDLEAGRLHVRQSLERLPDKTLRFKEPKTKKSRRTIPLGAHVVEALKAHRMAQAQSGLDFGASFNAKRLVFPWIDGEPWNPDKFGSAFYYYVRDHKLPLVSVHGLRHTHASLGLAAGVPMKIVSETLGHATVAITSDRYTHSIPTHHAASMALVDAALVAAINARDKNQTP